MHPVQLGHKCPSPETLVVNGSYRILNGLERWTCISPSCKVAQSLYKRVNTIAPPSNIVSSVHSTMDLVVIPVFPRETHLNLLNTFHF